MITLVYGGSGSGKSEYAEGLVTAKPSSDQRYYIATMRAYGEEGRQRVERHRKLRAGKGFQTIECPSDIGTVLKQIPEPEQAVLLLECMSNLTANEMFDSPQGEEGLPQRVLQGIQAIASQVKDLIIVSVNVFEDGIDYGDETKRYMKYLGQLNHAIAAMADQVFEVVVGIPIQIK